ncbi:hypothetical protein [Clostridium sp. C2-6-12]|uniref:hypothetical protein n=1 Tax=Clostridium sp. C2-6-12 TaxID=2698832 RepID=UPI00136D3C6D|nr:hypothetical protein [Clostridium sp. C2-6-12]
MIPLIIVSIVTLLSTIYVNRLIKYKFRNEKRSVWKKLHIVAYIVVFMPLLIILYLVWTDFLIQLR